MRVQLPPREVKSLAEVVPRRDATWYRALAAPADEFKSNQALPVWELITPGSPS